MPCLPNPTTDAPPVSDEDCPVIVRNTLCASRAVHTKQVHHRDFPEIRAEATSAVEGCAYLTGMLFRARDGAGSAWHRETIDLAIADVATALDALARGDAPAAYVIRP